MLNRLLPSEDFRLKQRRTKIVATVGPASSGKEDLMSLMRTGVDVFRLNMSHGETERHGRVYELIRRGAAELGKPVAILGDLSGPKIRVGEFREGGIELSVGQRVVVTTRDVVGEDGLVPSQYQSLHREVHSGERILLDDGKLELRVHSREGQDIQCEVVRGGSLTDRKGLNLPDSTLSTGALGEKDIEDAIFLSQLGVDFLALSFVQGPDDIERLRALLDEEECPALIAKIERKEALAVLPEILAAADGVMVARGDLGVELSPENVPVVQAEMIALARSERKPCIIATQMLESMVEFPQPTRAEVSDVSSAVFAAADAVMLSAETAIGKHPVSAVKTMDGVARRIESYLFQTRRFATDVVPSDKPSLATALASATAQLSREVRARAVVVVAQEVSNSVIQVFASARPAAPLLFLTPFAAAAHQATLLWGVVPVHISEERLRNPSQTASDQVQSLGLAGPTDRIITVEVFEREPGLEDARLNVVRIPS